MKHLITALTCACFLLPASAAHNLWMLPATSNQLNISHASGSESYILATTGTDPFVSLSNLDTDLADNETVLRFEYTATKALDHVELFFHYPATAGVSTVYAGLDATSGWKTATLDLSAGRTAFDWGHRGDQVRIDFGRVSGNTIQVRNMRIETPAGGDYVPRTDPYSEASVLALGFPVVEITTVDGEEPTCDYVSPPEGSIGAGIANATKVPGRVRVLNSDGSVMYDSGEYVKGESGMTVKIRGNTSAYTPKKPYKIKLQKKADMLCRGDKAYNDKNWVLIKDEQQLMRNGFMMNEVSGQAWAPQCRYVNVVFNGRFRGFYLLAESVERNVTGRLNVAEDGFIAEMDAYWWKENGQYFPSVLHPIHNYTLKYPDYEDLTSSQKAMIKLRLQQFEQSIPTGKYPDYIDVASFAAWLVAHDMLGTVDSAGSNMLLTRYNLDASTPIRMGNLWDFDSTEGTPGAWSNVHLHNFGKYFDSPDKSFLTHYVYVYSQLSKTVFTDMIRAVNEFAISDKATPFERSLNLDNEMWGTKYNSGAWCARRSINWYGQRWGWMNDAVAKLALTSGIDDVEAVRPITVSGLTVKTDGYVHIYDTMGRKVAEGYGEATVPASGLYLVVTPDGTIKVRI